MTTQEIELVEARALHYAVLRAGVPPIPTGITPLFPSYEAAQEHRRTIEDEYPACLIQPVDRYGFTFDREILYPDLTKWLEVFPEAPQFTAHSRLVAEGHWFVSGLRDSIRFSEHPGCTKYLTLRVNPKLLPWIQSHCPSGEISSFQVLWLHDSERAVVIAHDAAKPVSFWVALVNAERSLFVTA